MTEGLRRVRVMVVGTHPRCHFEHCSSITDVPTDVRVVFLDASTSTADDIVALKASPAPTRAVIAWVQEIVEVDRCLDLGFDAVALSERHAECIAAAWCGKLGRVDEIHSIVSDRTRLERFLDDIAESPSLADVLRFSIQHLSDIFGIERVSPVLFERDGVNAAVILEHNDYLTRLPIVLADYPELQKVASTRAPVVISDVNADDLLAGVRPRLTLVKDPHRSAVLFPLVHQGRVIGALFLRSSKAMSALSERVMVAGRFIASITAVAIGGAVEREALDDENRSLRDFERLFQASMDGILFLNAEGYIRYANPSAGHILSRSRALLNGVMFSEMLRPQALSLLSRSMRGEPVGDRYGYVDLHCKLPTDETRILSTAVRSAGDAGGVLVSFRDVSEQREIEEELRQTKNFLENLIQSSADAIVAADINGRLMLFNRAAEKMLGYSAREVVGRVRVRDLFPEGDARRVLDLIRSDAHGGFGRLELPKQVIVASDGTLVPTSLSAAIVYEKGQEIAVVCIVRDLREQLRMQAKLSEVEERLKISERQMGAMELAGTAAHELNQPLTVILGYASLLMRSDAVDPIVRERLDRIVQESDRMAHIVEKIGHITAYQTRPYANGANIVDLG